MSDEICIVQTIPTIQGEGINSGVPSLLIRIGGCNLTCAFCDTRWANVENISEKPNTIVLNTETLPDYLSSLKTFKEYKIDNVMITGGEPLLYSENSVFQDLLVFCLNNFNNFEIETNGTYIDDLVYCTIEWANGCDKLQLNISPKLNQKWYPDSIEYDRVVQNCKNISQLNNIRHWFKFVDNGKPGSRITMEQFIADTKLDPKSICLMPLTPPRPGVGESYLKYLGQYRINCMHTLKYCMQMGYRFVPRVHVFLFDDEAEKF